MIYHIPGFYLISTCFCCFKKEYFYNYQLHFFML